jgi:RimJ/RimL family protein N-acetyltransferase
MAEVTLRAVEPRDLDALYEHQADPAASRMAAVESRDRPAFDAHWAKVLRDPAVATRAVLQDEHLVGYLVAWREGSRTLVGYWLGRAHWGQGIAGRALMAFLAQLPTRPLHAHVAKGNAASIRVLEKCGFRRFGEGTIVHDGAEVPEWSYALAG